MRFNNIDEHPYSNSSQINPYFGIPLGFMSYICFITHVIKLMLPIYPWVGVRTFTGV